jgi:Outer membrane protein beta-barrel domain
MRRARRVWFLGVAVCMVMSGSAGAQTFNAGVKAGIAVTSIPLAGEVFDQVVRQTSRDSSSKVGLTGGGYIAFPLFNRLSFQPEALFVMKGVKLSETAGGSFSARLYYIDVPLLVRFLATKSSEKPAYLFAGPNFGIKLGSSAKLETATQTADIDINPALKTLDLGIAFGGGVERGRFLVEARLTMGTTDIGAASYPHPDALRNRAFSVMGGLKLR